MSSLRGRACLSNFFRALIFAWTSLKPFSLNSVGPVILDALLRLLAAASGLVEVNLSLNPVASRVLRAVALVARIVNLLKDSAERDFSLCFTLPFTTTRHDSSSGERRPARFVATSSSYESKLSPTCCTIIVASRYWFAGVQCICHEDAISVNGSNPPDVGFECNRHASRETTTGRSDNTNAHSATAAATFWNVSIVQNVCPCVTTGPCRRPPSQQSTSTWRQP
mmetsp:Transcript_86041/g.257846  ORF Transcript_86041/g.257846 Transcript_86041/m.257846 type:complete len:224 (+) Transcript_86041:1284-1955(+)